MQRRKTSLIPCNPLAIAYIGFIATDDEQLHLLLFETLESLKRFVQHVRPLKTMLARPDRTARASGVWDYS